MGLNLLSTSLERSLHVPNITEREKTGY
jgi:hypothetical protein